MAERRYDSDCERIPLPPGIDPAWLAKEGVTVLLNGGVESAEQLFSKFRRSSPQLAAGASLVDFITAAMTFEDEKMERAMESLKQTEKLCDVDNLFEGVFTRRPSDKCTVEERLERMIIWADCELFMAFLMFLKQSVVDFVKAGYYMRRAWKMYEKCHNEINKPNRLLNGVSNDKKGTPKKKPLGQNSSSPLPSESAVVLNSALSFGYGLIQMAVSIVPPGLLKICEMLGFVADREVGLKSLEMCSKSDDMKAPVARLALLWYHTVVRPFCALDGNNIEAGLADASVILEETEHVYPKSAIFLYFKALILRQREKKYSGVCLTYQTPLPYVWSLFERGMLDEALEVLQRAMASAVDQREIALLCYYDQGWCHMMRLEWATAIGCFAKLKEQSRWSEAYYTYLLAVAEGSLGRTKDAYEHLRTVPKLVVRKTQLENFLARKSQLYKKEEPSQEEYVLLSLELLYLWNALPQCGHDALRRALQELEKCKVPAMQPLKILVMGVIHAILEDNETATQYFHVASSKTDGKPVDAHVVPYALYELAMLYLGREETVDRGRSLLHKVKVYSLYLAPSSQRGAISAKI